MLTLFSYLVGQWGKLFVEGGRVINRSFRVVQDDLIKKAMVAAGFEDIQEHHIKVGYRA